MAKLLPEYEGTLRKNMIKVPKVIGEAEGISIFAKIIKSIIFTTDISIIKNCNADAVIAVYPFTPQPVITQAIMLVAGVPVFCGVGGGITTGKRTCNVALHAEFQGAYGVVVNVPTPNRTIEMLKKTIDIPVIVTVVADKNTIADRLSAGADILNVSGGADTAKLVEKIRQDFPEVPIIATGGPTDETITATILAGANAISWTPPTTAEILKEYMRKYRLE